ncbi:MAG: MBL fold metallo-hydrolase [Erysipelotrichaceae bacterium]
MQYYILASGSKGNCSLIRNHDTMIIIDCGTNWKYLSQEFHKNDLDYNSADGVLITHGHNDHIKSLKNLKHLKRYGNLIDSDITSLEYYQQFNIGSFRITPLALSHDSDNTTGYVIEDELEKLVFITDTGYLHQRNYQYINNADYFIIESNYDPETLLNTSRPKFLKDRILSDNGHLSNNDCCSILEEVVGTTTKEIVLAHLSQEANTQELAYNCLINSEVDTDNIIIKIAQQFETIKGGK